MQDIYFDEKYGKLYEKAEEGTAVCWKYDGPEGCVTHQFIMRQVPVPTEDGSWFDLVTPYGYGGPVVDSVRPGYSKADVVSGFSKAFQAYCEENKIVSEFVRFHPLACNAQDFETLYHVQYNRQTLGTNLSAYADPVAGEFSKSCRKSIRQALKKGVTWTVTKRPENLDVFRNIYYATMDRNDAGEYYYFDETYFSDCLRWFRENLILVEALYEEKTIAAGLYFVWADTIHVHLSGTLTEYLHLTPAYVLKYATAVWGKENGYRLIHYGGGKSNRPDDSLFLFKKKFAQNTEFAFYIGKKVWNEEAYGRLCAAAGSNPESAFFPAYRQK